MQRLLVTNMQSLRETPAAVKTKCCFGCSILVI